MKKEEKITKMTEFILQCIFYCMVTSIAFFSIILTPYANSENWETFLNLCKALFIFMLVCCIGAIFTLLVFLKSVKEEES